LVSNQFHLPSAFTQTTLPVVDIPNLPLLAMHFITILSTLLTAASAAVAVPLVDSIQHVQSVAHAHHHPMPATHIHVPKLTARTGTRISSDDSHMSNSCNSE
jgi:hypothetical protein